LSAERLSTSRRRHFREAIATALVALGSSGCGMLISAGSLEKVDCVSDCDAGVDAGQGGSDTDASSFDAGNEASALPDGSAPPDQDTPDAEPADVTPADDGNAVEAEAQAGQPDAPSDDGGDATGPTVDAEAGADSSPPGRCDDQAPFTLLYWDTNPGAVDGVDFLIKVKNASPAPVNLSSLAIRYYITNEYSPGWTVSTWYEEVCCSSSGFVLGHTHASVHPLVPATATASSYIEITFDSGAGNVVPGDVLQVEAGIIHGQEPYNQTNDYSYSATNAGKQMEWDQCPGAALCTKFRSCNLTVYKDGILVWGTPPR
jgi:Cellulose binding domain